ncbi:hypothetical protein A4R44_06238 [Amycolatopsis sp. M39]|uniref:Uncharacterized protein n=1 Tax=Amycolatopsis rubida TaxID=112413 RepID=A0A1I5SKY9_9PSEU|nr:hypothetical protein A4R44_06238 [Amycolatopsis sp. M39]SFP71372.1 hypothetical protein SAMN05421854_106359 [Amycolatopsis rubida]
MALQASVVAPSLVVFGSRWASARRDPVSRIWRCWWRLALCGLETSFAAIRAACDEKVSEGWRTRRRVEEDCTLLELREDLPREPEREAAAEIQSPWRTAGVFSPRHLAK